MACSTCLVGDPTLTLMGTEKSYSGRLRLSLLYGYRTEEVGVARFNQIELTEHRTTLGLTYAFNKDISLSARLPYLDKRLEYANLAEQNNRALGDLELTGKITLSTDDLNAHRHLWGTIVGIRLPTASEQKTINGQTADIDNQTGTGAYVPQAGVWYGFYRYPYFIYTSGVVHYAFEGFGDFKAGTAVVGTVTTQYAINYKIALQLGLDSRWSAANHFDGQTDPDSGGIISFLSPKLIYSPTSDLIIHFGFQYPVLNRLDGEHKEGTTIELGVTYDF